MFNLYPSIIHFLYVRITILLTVEGIYQVFTFIGQQFWFYEDSRNPFSLHTSWGYMMYSFILSSTSTVNEVLEDDNWFLYAKRLRKTNGYCKQTKPSKRNEVV